MFVDNSVKVTNAKVQLSGFLTADDPSIIERGLVPGVSPAIDDRVLTAGRAGFFLPRDGIVKNSPRIKVFIRPSVVGFAAPKTESGKVMRRGQLTKVPPEDVRQSVTKEGRRYFFVRGLAEVPEYAIVTYRVRLQVTIREEDDGWFALFQDPVPAGELTWLGNVGDLDGDISWDFRDGANDQDDAPIEDQVAQTFVVGTGEGDLLQNGESQTHDTKNEVHDVLVEIVSGADGFFHQRIGSRQGTAGMRRHVQIMLKEKDAPDVIQPFEPGLSKPSADLAKGWVRLRDINRNNVTFRLEGEVKGVARWFFSVADLYAFTMDNDRPNLPLRRYSVKVLAKDNSSIFSNDQDDIEFGSATEIVRTPLSLPNHSLLIVRVKDSLKAGDFPTFRVQMAMRQVWIPEPGATLDADSGLLEPGDYVWTRNPVWCACDIITNDQFGAGEHYGWASIRDLDAMFAAADFCDFLIDGEPRSELDIFITKQDSTWNTVLGILAGSRILAPLEGGNWRFIIDQAETPVPLPLTDDDFVSLRRVWASPDELPNELDVSVTLDDFDFLPTQHPVRLVGKDEDPSKRIIRPISMIGVRRQEQINQHGAIILRQFQTTTQTVQGLGKTFRLHRLRAGCVVSYTSERFKFTAKEFRIDSTGYEATTFRPAIQMAEYDASAYGAEAQAAETFQGDTNLTADPKSPQSNQSPTQIIVTKLNARRVAS